MAVHAQFFPENLGFPFAGSQDWAGDYGRGGGGFSQFCLQKQQQQQQQQMCQTECSDDGFILSSLRNHHRTAADDGGHRFATFSQCVTAHVDKQKQEIDHYIRLQNESLRFVLREQGKQQIATLLKRVELKTAIMLRHKEEEIARAAKKTMELEIFLGKLETENQVWQRIAQENEAMAMSLNNTLDQMREMASNCFDNGGAAAADDVESCCDMNREEEEEEAAEVTTKRKNRECSDFEKRKMTKMVCRGCNSRNSCVIFLPCRHLCSCKDCEAVLDSCPVCRTGKKASIEALIF